MCVYVCVCVERRETTPSVGNDICDWRVPHLTCIDHYSTFRVRKLCGNRCHSPKVDDVNGSGLPSRKTYAKT